MSKRSLVMLSTKIISDVILSVMISNERFLSFISDPVSGHPPKSWNEVIAIADNLRA